MKGRSAKEKAFRDQIVPREDFQCACGCDLQLSRGDLLDATLLLARFGGKPRTWGVDISPKPSDQKTAREPPDPQVGRPCSKCGDMVYLPDYAAKMLDDRKCFWPLCRDCQKPTKQLAPPARQYWE